jgi:cathepsin E
MFPTTLLTTLLLALSVAANPVLVNRSPVSLPISRRVNLTSIHNLLRHDQNRAKALKLNGAALASGSPIDKTPVVSSQVDNQAVTYVAAVNIGNPATTYQLLVDTGSSNTWLGANQAYKQTKTSTQTKDSVSVTYGSGFFEGTEWTDRVTIASGLTINKQSIGVADFAEGFNGVDGIIGIGPLDLTVGTLSPDSSSSIPTVTDNLFSAGTIPSHSIGISFEPTNTDTDLNGEITWGGTDSKKFTGSVSFIPLTTTSPSNLYWGINQSIRYGKSTSLLATTAGIVDTGTTLVLLASDAFAKYQTATGAVLDDNTGLLTITATQFKNLQSLFFTAGGHTFELTANAQIWPRSLNTDIGGTTGTIYLITNDLGSPSGEGFDFINGYGFLERFYSVFDTANKRVGFATTPFTDATTN